MQKKAHVAQWKKNEVSELIRAIQKYKIIGIADMTGMPSPQLQKMRSLLKKSVEIKMSKASLIKLAIENLKAKINGLDKLLPYIEGMPCLILTNDNPFALSKTLKKSKSKAPAKPGQTAPNNIIIPAGPTSFAPGPVIGELGALGIKATIAEGKVTIKEDAHIINEGQVISAPLAAMLTRLNIMPMEIGINLLVVLENGEILTKDVLFVDEAKYLTDLKQAASWAFNLAFNSAYPTGVTLPLLIKRAHLDAEALADSRNIMTSKNVKRILGKAHAQMESLKARASL
jgi:large subunit ribosomal protein L10